LTMAPPSLLSLTMKRRNCYLFPLIKKSLSSPKLNHLFRLIKSTYSRLVLLLNVLFWYGDVRSRCAFFFLHAGTLIDPCFVTRVHDSTDSRFLRPSANRRFTNKIYLGG
jgi:hypothetical protein